ncbi:hypothetical protein PASE110613_08700 [Paenibacillus sediminis]|uniref:Ribosomal protein S20 n=1 Tax=Paenibacillus sediminis TaxID=664909 RepID=A0ABS4H6E7_9BACL|nr:hypothetical protein [Paenibacillus sediminis]MBP1938114.1 ribosomal protein S20 [Paenibacillus sediminis]
MKQKHKKMLIATLAAGTIFAGTGAALFTSNVSAATPESSTAQDGTSTQAAQNHDHKYGHRGLGGHFVRETAELLGVEADSLFKELRNGKTLLQIVQEKKGWSESEYLDKLTSEVSKHIDEAVTKGKLTKEKAEEIKTNLPEQLKEAVENKFDMNHPKGAKHGHRFNFIEETATLIGTDANSLMDQLKEGKTLLQIVEEKKGWSEDEYLNKLTAVFVKEIDADVSKGKLTKEKADEIKSSLTSHLKKAVENKMPDRPKFDRGPWEKKDSTDKSEQ